MSGPIDPDRLYNLLPQYLRVRDFDAGEPLRGLLAVISEQVEVVEADIRQLYENWFIETCDDWVVPYIADLVGYQPAHEAGEPGGVATAEERLKNRFLVPRRELANTIGNRRRKGTLALLDDLAGETAGWPGRAVEFGRLVAVTLSLNQPRPDRGRTADLRRGDALDRINGPFDELAHTADLRRVNSHRTPGRYNLPEVGLFAWRLAAFPVERAPAFPYDQITGDEDDGNKYFFSPLGNHTLLYARPVTLPDRTHITDERNVPVPIRLRSFAERTPDYYGPGKSLMIWRDGEPVPADDIVAADLTNWVYTPRGRQVAVDPRLGLIAFSRENEPDETVTVSYHYGFSAQIGGRGYPRPTAGQSDFRVQQGVQPDPNAGLFPTIAAALAQWRDDVQKAPPDDPKLDWVIEIIDSAQYDEAIEIRLPAGKVVPPAQGAGAGQTMPPINLTLRAASGQRPVIRLAQPGHHRDAMLLASEHKVTQDNPGGRLVLDGLLITGWVVHVHGFLTEVVFRHCTLVPGLGLDLHCAPKHHDHPSLKVTTTTAWVTIEKSIVGPVRVEQGEDLEPLRLDGADSILDALSPLHPAIHGDCEGDFARASLTIKRATVLGGVKIHEVGLAEDSIFTGVMLVERRQTGCVRFCYVPYGSRTPRRFECQPDQAVAGLCPPADPAAQAAARRRVRPLFESERYGTPTYARLGDACPPEISRGADDESEMGAFHDLFQPQREANLRARLDEYTPAGTDASLILPSGDEHDT